MNSGDIVVKPFDNPLVSETVIFVILHVDDQMLMYLDSDNVAALMIFRVTSKSSVEGERSFEGWLWHKIMAAELARMAGFSTSLGLTSVDDRTPTETMFSPIMAFLALSRATTNDSLSGWPLVRMRFWIRACA